MTSVSSLPLAPPKTIFPQPSCMLPAAPPQGSTPLPSQSQSTSIGTTPYSQASPPLCPPPVGICAPLTTPPTPVNLPPTTYAKPVPRAPAAVSPNYRLPVHSSNFQSGSGNMMFPPMPSNMDPHGPPAYMCSQYYPLYQTASPRPSPLKRAPYQTFSLPKSFNIQAIPALSANPTPPVPISPSSNPLATHPRRR